MGLILQPDLMRKSKETANKDNGGFTRLLFCEVTNDLSDGVSEAT